MSDSDLFSLPAGMDPLALLDVGLGPSGADRARSELALSKEEVAAMLPAYDVQHQLGQGGMGAVYAAVQRDLQRRVAIKLLSPALANKAGLTVRFRHESQLMASLQHPGIVQVYEAGETAEGHLYYVMEFVDGEDLASRMHRGRLPMDEAVSVISAVADALHAAHALGIVHRDVKPANIFLSAQGPPKLGDFGLALTAEQAEDPLRLTRAGTTVGTVEYAAPEQLARTHSVTAASDVFSLGVLTYEMLTGELPRGNFDPPSVRNPAVDAAFDGVVLHALQTDPLRRFAHAGEFRTAFLHAADRRRQQELRDQVGRRKLVRRAWLLAVLAAVSCITGGSALLAWKARREADQRRAVAQSAEQRMAGLLQYLLTDLRQRLEPTGNLGAMESVMDKAVEHFRKDYADAGKSPEAALKLADVLVVKADVIGVRGLKDEAEALYTEALTLTQQARSADPQSVDRNLRVIRAWTDRIEHRMDGGTHEKALADSREMLTEATALVAMTPEPRARLALARAHRAVANALGYTGPFEGAWDEYLEAQRLLAELSAAAPEDKNLANELAMLDTSLGSNAEARGDFPMMLRYFTTWHEHVLRVYGRDSEMYSHAAFRMGVAHQKTGDPAAALPHFKDAMRIAERLCAKLPGHKGHLNHLSWCLRRCAQAHEELGHTAEAAALRKREQEVNAQFGATPELAKSSVEEEFARLVSLPDTDRASWWAFCKKLERSAETLPAAQSVPEFYEKWLTRLQERLPADDPGNFIRLVPAFIHNRLASLCLEKDPAQAAEHVQQAFALREAVALVHPDDPELHRDVLSSACYVADSALRGEDVRLAEASFQKLISCSQRLSSNAVALANNGLFFAERIALLLETAAKRWPTHTEGFRHVGTEVSSSLLDGLPQEIQRQPAALALRARLTKLGEKVGN